MEIGYPYINRLKQANLQMDGIKVPYLSHLKINSPPGMFFLDVHFSLEAELVYQKHTTPHQYKREDKHTLFIYSLRFYIYLLKFATLFQADMQSDKLVFSKRFMNRLHFFSFFSAKKMAGNYSCHRIPF